MTRVESWVPEGDVGHVRHVDGGLEIVCLDETLRAKPRWVMREGHILAVEYALRPLNDPDGASVWTIYLRGDMLWRTASQAEVFIDAKHPVTQKMMLYDIGNALLASTRYLPVTPI